MRRKGKRSNNNAILGDHNMISDITGFKYKASEMRRMEGLDEGLWCHSSEWNPESPQLHIRAREDDQTVAITRPRPTDIFESNSSGDYLLQNGDTFIFNSSIPLEVSFN